MPMNRYYQQKMFCYLWTDKKTHEPYIGIVEGNKIDHPLLGIRQPCPHENTENKS